MIESKKFREFLREAVRLWVQVRGQLAATASSRSEKRKLKDITIMPAGNLNSKKGSTARALAEKRKRASILHGLLEQ